MNRQPDLQDKPFYNNDYSGWFYKHPFDGELYGPFDTQGEAVEAQRQQGDIL